MAHRMTPRPKGAASRKSSFGRGNRPTVIYLVLVALSLSCFVPCGARVWAGGVRGEQEEHIPRPARATVIESVPGGSGEKLLLKYNEFMKGAGAGLSSSPEGQLSDADYATLKGFVQELYTEAGRGGGSAHKKVALLITSQLDEGATSEAFNILLPLLGAIVTDACGTPH